MSRTRFISALLGAALLLLLALAPAASAQEENGNYPLGTTPPTVLDNSLEKDPPAVLENSLESDPQVLSAQVESGSLPVTGGDVVGLVVMGLVAIGVGVGLVRYQRSAVRV